LSFENGTKTLISQSGAIEVGTRMLFQLRKNESLNYDAFCQDVENQKLPGAVIQLLAAGMRFNLENLTSECR